MRAFLHTGPIVALLGVAAATSGCGLTVVGKQNASGDAGSAPEPRIEMIACGTTECPAASQICCLGYSTGSCIAKGAGTCPPVPSAPAMPPPPPLACTTYRNCDEGEQCCYEPSKGSSCAKTCANFDVNLCLLQKDDCGKDASCDDYASAPQAGIGRCIEDTSGG